MAPVQNLLAGAPKFPQSKGLGDGVIYFIHGETTKKIKIGFTDAPIFEGRFQPMKSSSPDRLSFLGGMPGDRGIERELHKKFQSCHSHGEWYFESKEIYDFVDDNCIKDMNAFEVVLPEIENGDVSWEEALSMTNDDIEEMQKARISKAFKGLWRGIKAPQNT